MKTVNIKIDEDTRAILRRCTIDRMALQVGLRNITMERALYVKVNAVLEALGGKWKRKVSAHVFTTDPSAALEEICAGGAVVDKKKTFQAFFTPDALADELIKLAHLFSSARVLEPSAGDGALVKACRRAESDLVIHSVEINPDHYRPLLDVSNAVYTTDFLKMRPRDAGKFDRVVMNSPFSKRAGTGAADVDHVMHAFKFLRPGGRLAAIVSPGFRFWDDAGSIKFREMHETFGARDVGRDENASYDYLGMTPSGVAGEINVPTGAFKESGTGIATVIVVWDMPLQP